MDYSQFSNYKQDLSASNDDGYDSFLYKKNILYVSLDSSLKMRFLLSITEVQDNLLQASKHLVIDERVFNKVIEQIDKIVPGKYVFNYQNGRFKLVSPKSNCLNSEGFDLNSERKFKL